MPRVILCRFGELFLKSGNRRRFEDMLLRSVQIAVARLPGVRVQPTHGRILVHVPDDADGDEVTSRLTRVFGLVSVSSADAVAPELGAIGEAAIAIARAAAASRPTPPTFKIEARRSDKTFPTPSTEIGRQVGAAVVAATGLPVDVHDPQLRIGVEVAPGHAYVFGGELACPGGLPIGSAGRGCCCCRAASTRRWPAGWRPSAGWRSDAVYFHSPPVHRREVPRQGGRRWRDSWRAGRALRRRRVVPSPRCRSGCATPVRPSWRWSCTGA